MLSSHTHTALFDGGADAFQYVNELSAGCLCSTVETPA